MHVHVLPGIDDGPRSMAEAIALATDAAHDGVDTLVATPHVRPDHPFVQPLKLGQRVEVLRSHLRASGVPIEIVQGAEVDLLWALQAPQPELVAASYGGRGTDLLIETPYGPLPPRFDELIFGLAVRGFRILLAHPERNPTFQHAPRRLSDLVERGTLLQITASSLVQGGRNSKSRRLASALVSEELAHVIASDAHGPHTSRANLLDGAEAAGRLAPARAQWLVNESPAAILAGEPLPEPPASSRRPSLLRRRG